MKTYNVKCLKCKKSNEVIIKEDGNDFIIDLDTYHKKNPDNINIISGRYRKDLKFGWECICGNTSIIARQEFRDIDSLVPGGKDKTKIIINLTNSLKHTDKQKFTMKIV